MKFVGFDIDTICGFAFGVEYADSEWVDGRVGGYFIVVDFTFLRFIFEFTK